MNKQSYISRTIITALQEKIGCPIIRANQGQPKIPKYPYVSYTIITPFIWRGGTWGRRGGDLIHTKEFEQVWSFTVHSSSDMETFDKTTMLYTLLECPEELLPELQGIAVVRKLSDVANRDNFITVEYECRQGFDVTFAFMRVVEIVPEMVPVDIKYEKRGNNG